MLLSAEVGRVTTERSRRVWGHRHTARVLVVYGGEVAVVGTRTSRDMANMGAKGSRWGVVRSSEVVSAVEFSV
jgi:hypothetical protein